VAMDRSHGVLVFALRGGWSSVGGSLKYSVFQLPMIATEVEQRWSVV